MATMNQTLMEVVNTIVRQHHDDTSTTTNNNNDEQLAKIRELLVNGADANYVGIGANNLKWTPLAYACHHGHLQLAEILIQHGANINGTQMDHDKSSSSSSFPSHTFTEAPLYCATMNGHLEVVEFLLQQKQQEQEEANAVNVNIVNSVGETPLYAACMYGSSGAAVIERLLQHKGCNVDQANVFGETPLYAACRRGFIWIVRLLLKYGAMVDQAKHGDGTTPICIAALHEHHAIVKLLLQNNATVVVKDQITVEGFMRMQTNTANTSYNEERKSDPFAMIRRNTRYVEKLLLSSKDMSSSSSTTSTKPKDITEPKDENVPKTTTTK